MAKLLNISHTNPDEQLAATLKVIDDREEHAVAGLEQLEQKLKELAQSLPSVTERWLDLIGHGYGVLQLGDWAIESDPPRMSAFAASCRESLQALRVTKVRLLGCSTASTDAGQDAIMTLHAAFAQRQLNIDVVGTTMPLCAEDFDAAGLKSDFRGVVNRENLPRWGAPEELGGPPSLQDDDIAWAVRRDEIFRRFQPVRPGAGLLELTRGIAPEPLASILRERDDSPRRPPWEVRLVHTTPGILSPIQAVLLPAAATAPGLLAGTEVELIIPASSPPEQTFYRFTVLLDSSFVRIRLLNEPLGRLLPVTSRDDLRALLESAVPLPARDMLGRCQCEAQRMPSM
jgi:hypothetical protein